MMRLYSFRHTLVIIHVHVQYTCSVTICIISYTCKYEYRNISFSFPYFVKLLTQKFQTSSHVMFIVTMELYYAVR